MDIRIAQNFVKEFKEKDKIKFKDYTFGPCIILLYPYKTSIHYCHFDEYNLEELKTFTNIACNRTNKIAFFGGYRSQNIPSLFKHFRVKGIEKITDKDLVDSPPIKRIEIYNKDISFLGDFGKQNYSLRQLQEIWKQ